MDTKQNTGEMQLKTGEAAWEQSWVRAELVKLDQNLGGSDWKHSPGCVILLSVF